MFDHLQYQWPVIDFPSNHGRSRLMSFNSHMFLQNWVLIESWKVFTFSEPLIFTKRDVNTLILIPTLQSSTTLGYCIHCIHQDLSCTYSSNCTYTLNGILYSYIIQWKASSRLLYLLYAYFTTVLLSLTSYKI